MAVMVIVFITIGLLPGLIFALMCMARNKRSNSRSPSPQERLEKFYNQPTRHSAPATEFNTDPALLRGDDVDNISKSTINDAWSSSTDTKSIYIRGEGCLEQLACCQCRKNNKSSDEDDTILEIVVTRSGEVNTESITKGDIPDERNEINTMKSNQQNKESDSLIPKLLKQDNQRPKTLTTTSIGRIQADTIVNPVHSDKIESNSPLETVCEVPEEIQVSSQDIVRDKIHITNTHTTTYSDLISHHADNLCKSTNVDSNVHNLDLNGISSIVGMQDDFLSTHSSNETNNKISNNSLHLSKENNYHMSIDTQVRHDTHCVYTLYDSLEQENKSSIMYGKFRHPSDAIERQSTKSPDISFPISVNSRVHRRGFRRLTSYTLSGEKNTTQLPELSSDKRKFFSCAPLKSLGPYEMEKDGGEFMSEQSISNDLPGIVSTERKKDGNARYYLHTKQCLDSGDQSKRNEGNDKEVMQSVQQLSENRYAANNPIVATVLTTQHARISEDESRVANATSYYAIIPNRTEYPPKNEEMSQHRPNSIKESPRHTTIMTSLSQRGGQLEGHSVHQNSTRQSGIESETKELVEESKTMSNVNQSVTSNSKNEPSSLITENSEESSCVRATSFFAFTPENQGQNSPYKLCVSSSPMRRSEQICTETVHNPRASTKLRQNIDRKMQQMQPITSIPYNKMNTRFHTQPLQNQTTNTLQPLSFTTVESSSFYNSNAIYKQGSNHLNIRDPDTIYRQNPVMSTMLNEDNQLKEPRRGSTFEESTYRNERVKRQPHQRNVNDVRLEEFEPVVAHNAYKKDNNIIEVERCQTFDTQNTFAQNKTIQSAPTENSLTQSPRVLNSSTVNVHCNHQGEVCGLPNTSYCAAIPKNQGQYYPFRNVRNDSEQIRSLNDHVIKKHSLCISPPQNTSSPRKPTPTKRAPIHNALPYSYNNNANNCPLIQRQHGVGVPVTSYNAILPNNHGQSYLSENIEKEDDMQKQSRFQNPFSSQIPANSNAPAQISPTSNKSIHTQQPTQSRLIQTSPQFIKQKLGVARSSPLTSYYAIPQNIQDISSSYPYDKINKSKNVPDKHLSVQKPNVDQNSIRSFAPAQNLRTQNAPNNITTTQYVPFTKRQEKQEGGLPSSSYYAIVPKDQGQSYPYANVRISENATNQINTHSTDTAPNDLFSVTQAQNTPTHSLSSIRNVGDKSQNELINENRQVLTSINRRLDKEGGDNERMNYYSPQQRKSPILSSLLKRGGPSVEGQIGSTSALASRYAFASMNNREEQNTVVCNTPHNMMGKITINQRQVSPHRNQQSTMLNHQPMINTNQNDTNNDSSATSNNENGFKNWESFHSNSFGEEVKTAIPSDYQNMNGLKQDLITAQNHSNVVKLTSAQFQQKPDKQQGSQEQNDRRNQNKYEYDHPQSTYVRSRSTIISSTDKSEKSSALSRASRMKTIWNNDDDDTISRFPFTSYYAFVPRNQGEIYPLESMKFVKDSSGIKPFVKQNQLTHSMMKQKAERDDEKPDPEQIQNDTTKVQTSQNIHYMKDRREHTPTQNNYAIRSHNSQPKRSEELNSRPVMPSYEAMLPIHCQTRLQNNCRQNNVRQEQLVTANDNLKLKAAESSIVNQSAERKDDIKSTNKLPVESSTGTTLLETLRECKKPPVSWDILHKKETMKVPKPYSMHIPGDSEPSEETQWNKKYDDIMVRKAISTPSLLSRGKVGDMQRGDMQMEKRVSKFFNNYQFIPEIPRLQTVMYEQAQPVRNVVPHSRENIHILPEQNTNLIPLLINRPARSVQDPNNSSHVTHHDLQNRGNLSESNSFPSTSFYGFIPRNQGQYSAREGIFAHPGYTATGADYIPYNVINPITMRSCIKAEESEDESDSTSESSDESYEQIERKPVYSVPKPVYWKRIDQKRQEENAVEQRAEKQRVHDILNQFSSIHISHNMKDPIPKDPETMPGFKTSTSRRQLAESLSYYGSSQYRMLPSKAQVKQEPRSPEERKSHSFFNRNSKNYSILIAENNQGISSGVQGKESDDSVEMKSDNLERSVIPDPEHTGNTEEQDGKYEETPGGKNSSSQLQLDDKYGFDSKSSRHCGKTWNDSNIHMLRDNSIHTSSRISGRKSNQIFDGSSFVPMQSSPSSKVKFRQKLSGIPTGTDSLFSLNEEKVLSIHSPNSLPKINHLSREINSSSSTIVYQQENSIFGAKSISRMNVAMVEPDEVEPYASPRHGTFEAQMSNKQTDSSRQYDSYQQDANSIIVELIDKAVSSNGSPTLRILPTPPEENSEHFRDETEKKSPYSNKKSVHFIAEHTNNKTLQAAQKGKHYEWGDKNVDNSLASVNYQPSVVEIHSQISPQCVQMPNRKSEEMSCDILGGSSYEFINMANFKSVTQQVSSRLYRKDDIARISDETNDYNLESRSQAQRKTSQCKTGVVEQNLGSRRSFVYSNDNLTSMQLGNATNQSFVFRREMSLSKKTHDAEDSQFLDSLNKKNTAHDPQPTRESKIVIQSIKRGETDPAPLDSTSNSSDRNTIASIIELTAEPSKNVIFTSEREVAERLRDKGVKHISEVYSPDFWKRRKLSTEEQEKETDMFMDSADLTANTTITQDSEEDTSNEYSCLHVSSSLKIDGVQNGDKEKSIDIKEKNRFTGAIESSLCHGVRQPSSRQERRSSKNVYFTLPHEPSNQEDTCSLERFTKNSKVQTSFPGVPAIGTDTTLRWSVVIKHRANQLLEAQEAENEHCDTEPYTTPRSNE